ncbi:MAG: lipid-A-disaccharide synthase [Thermoanaerobaculia bacterium]|nr:lipid-A-disaccharide synthase [Thermoanaerobaculia bacterium]
MSRILVVAGEASGDLHAARLVSALSERRGSLEVFGLGGDELASTGAELLAHSREIAVVGITEVLKILPRARAIYRELLDEVDERNPDLAILVDFPDFNLRLAKKLAEQELPVAYYISPQVWAWRKGRIETIARTVDRMLVLFPFEVDFYREHGVEVVHVGHPLVDEVPELPSIWDRDADPELFRLALLPGSRGSEVAALLPVMLASAARIGREVPVKARVVRAPTVEEGQIRQLVGESGLEVEIVAEDRFATVADSHLALCASGTATLEVGMLTTPMVVLYRLQFWSYLFARWLVDLPAFSLVNLVLEERVVPELLQREANPRRVAEEGLRLLRDGEARRGLRSKLAEVRERLGEGGGSRRAAAAVDEMLEELS